MSKQRIVERIVICPSCKTKKRIRMDLNAPDIEGLKSLIEICGNCNHEFIIEGNLQPDEIRNRN